MYNDITTNRTMALPDNNYTAQKFEEFFNQPANLRNIKRQHYRDLETLKHFNWDDSSAAWYKAITTAYGTPKPSWNSPPRTYPINNNLDREMSNEEFVKWLIVDVLREPERLYTIFILSC